MILSVDGPINIFRLLGDFISELIAFFEIPVVWVRQSAFFGLLFLLVPLGYEIESLDLVPEMRILKLQGLNVLLRLLVVLLIRSVLCLMHLKILRYRDLFGLHILNQEL